MDGESSVCDHNVLLGYRMSIMTAVCLFFILKKECADYLK